ncbi:MAG: hypothetical protein MI922_30015, partial [Bacteroidales bacterium]|nr:hypothetical protein [Bacteroidales bacterium]
MKKTMYPGVIAVAIALVIIMCNSCEKDSNENPNNGEGTVAFILDNQLISKASSLKSTNPMEKARYVLISVETSSGESVYNTKALPITFFNEAMVSEPLLLKAGDYKLTWFTVTDSSSYV